MCTKYCESICYKSGWVRWLKGNERKISKKKAGQSAEISDNDPAIGKISEFNWQWNSKLGIKNMKANSILKQIGLGLAITSLAACQAGAIVAYNFGSVSANQNFNGTLAETFSVQNGVTISVTSLGAFDPSGFGSSTPEVAIYSVPVVGGVMQMGSASLVSPIATFTSGSYTVSGNTASIGITPTTLGAGVYMIVASGLPSDYDTFTGVSAVTTTGAGLTFGAPNGGPGTFYGFNTTLDGGLGTLYADGGPANRYGAGTFDYFSSVPESQTFAVAGVAMLGLVFIGRKVIPFKKA